MKFDTYSEELFAGICIRHGYQVEKLPTRSKQSLKTADFVIETPHCRLIAEIEELTPNKDDQRQIEEMHETGATDGGRKIGARARAAIRRAAVQLKDHRNENLPMIAVLYDNVRTSDGRVGYPMFYLEHHDIDAAMYGDRVMHVSLGGSPSVVPDRNGAARTTTTGEKNYLSAIVVISDWDDKTLYIYHNRFARVALPFEVFSDTWCYHYQKSEQTYSEPWTWHPVMKG